MSLTVLESKRDLPNEAILEPLNKQIQNISKLNQIINGKIENLSQEVFSDLENESFQLEYNEYCIICNKLIKWYANYKRILKCPLKISPEAEKLRKKIAGELVKFKEDLEFLQNNLVRYEARRKREENKSSVLNLKAMHEQRRLRSKPLIALQPDFNC